ncbi:DUF4265 domain-containing protein [Puia sp. P3]|uniref:DUF4265 domain-containing protein n=1 Tax=Puia sp. P3 TaxID=3423952 RepID=UPI003D67A625
MPDNKLILPYKDDEGSIRGETVLATKEGKYYRITSIPLYASKIALYDLIDVRDREGVLYFHKIIEGSGRSVIQMMVFNKQEINFILKDLEQFGCLWQCSDDKHLIAFDVPKLVPYQPIKDWLDQGQQEERWGYRGACLSHK